MSHVIKRSTELSEPFDKQKLRRSIIETCLSVRTPIGEAVITAEHVCLGVLTWLERHEEVTSADIRRKASETLSIHNPDASTVYEQFDVMA